MRRELLTQTGRREPRVDAELYQASIPALLNRSIHPPPPLDEDYVMVCSGESSPRIDEYLGFCRKLTGAVLPPSSSSSPTPLEEDEQALEFLQVEARGSVDRAKLLLIAALGGGSSFQAVKDPEKPRGPKSKTAYRVLMCDQPAGTAEVAKPLWDQWAARVKKLLQLPAPWSAVDLILAMHEARQLPLFRQQTCEEQHVSQMYDVLYQLESRTREVEEYIARVHDALSPVRSEDKWTTQELKKLAEEGPRKASVVEADLLRDMALECEAWEKLANKWLQDSSTVRFTLSGLRGFIAQGRHSPADHVGLLLALEKRQSECQSASQRLGEYLHGQTNVPLIKLVEMRDWLARLGLETEMDRQLHDLVSGAQEWLREANHLSELTVEDLRQLVRFESGVDLNAERAELKLALERCEAWQQQLKDLWPDAATGVESCPPEHAVDALNALLADPLPAIVPEERQLRASMQILNWSNTALGLLQAPQGSLALDVFEKSLEELDGIVHLFDGLYAPTATTSKRPSKKSKRSLPLLEHEEEIRQVVRQGSEWIKAAHALAQQPATWSLGEDRAHKRLAYQEYMDVTSQKPRVWVDPALVAGMEARSKLLSEWQASTKARLELAEGGSLPLSEAELANLVREAGEWGVDTPELASLQRIHHALRDWRDQCDLLFVSEDATTTTTKSSAAAQAKKKKNRQAQDRSDLGEQDVLRLRERGLALGVQVSLTDVEACIQATQEWKSLLLGPLERYRRANALPGAESSFALDQVLVRGNPSLLHHLRLVNADEAFPHEPETRAWREHDLSMAAEDALDEIIQGMQEAEDRQLFKTGLDSPEIQACAWLIQADIWLDRVKTEVIEATVPVGLMDVCQLVFMGAKLLFAGGDGEDGALLLAQHDTFPEKVLEAYFNSSLPYSKRPKLLPNTSSTSTPTTATTAAATAAVSPSTSAGVVGEYIPDELIDLWPIFKHIKESNCFVAEGGMHSTMQHANVTGVMLSRLFGLTRTAQRFFAARNLVLTTLPRIPRTERTLDLLGASVHQAAQWTKTLPLAESTEEAKLRQDWTASEACHVEVTKALKQQPLATVDVLEKLANKADKHWVDMALVTQIKLLVKSCRAWMDRAHEALDSDALQPGLIKKLVSEGQELNKTVNVSALVQELKQTTDVMCMCRGPRSGNMLGCIDCKEIFHRECVSSTTTTTTTTTATTTATTMVCPVCTASRAVTKTVGYGYAAICRVFCLELMGGDVVLDQSANRTVLVEWMRLAREAFQKQAAAGGGGGAELPPAPKELEHTFEVKAVCDAFAAFGFSFKLDKLRLRPALEALEYTLSIAPSTLPPASLVSLYSLATRGRALSSMVDDIWRLPAATTPASVVLAKCNDALAKIGSLPLDMSVLQKRLQACVDDKANRHCVCQQFDQGTMMLACVRCEKWFHQACVGGTGGGSEGEEFTCGKCRQVVK